MASVAPRCLALPDRVSKRKQARDGMVRKYADIILQYEKVLLFIPQVNEIVPKRVWEQQMHRSRQLLRSIEACEEEGRRQDLHHYIRQLYSSTSNDQFRLTLPDPSDECTDSEWINANLDFMQRIWM